MTAGSLIKSSLNVASNALNIRKDKEEVPKKSVIVVEDSITSRTLLKNVLEILKDADYIDYRISGPELKIEIKKVNMIRAIKPRYTVPVKKINAYVRRYLPAKNFGFLVKRIFNNKGNCKRDCREAFFNERFNRTH